MNAPNEGRDSLACTNASRAALWLPPLRTGDGGHRVSGGTHTRLPSVKPRRWFGWLTRFLRIA